MALWPEEYEGFRDEARQMADALRGYYAGGASGEVPTDQAGVFRPQVASRGTYVHFHGGAMMLGSPLMNDVSNAGLCERLGVTVISVDYRLAPEHPFPAGSDDCLAVSRWALEREDGPIILGGESAGGYYAALTLLRIRDDLDAVHHISGANLVFGVYDLSGTPTSRGARPTDVADLLEESMFSFVNECYIPGRSLEDARDPAVSPLYADLAGLPPALFTVGSADHLLDDSLFMAARWQAYGNEAELAVYPDCIHGFTAMPMELAKRANERIDAFLERVLG